MGSSRWAEFNVVRADGPQVGKTSEEGCYNSCPRGSMSNLGNVVGQLRQERDQAQKRVEQLDAALEALSGVGSLYATTKTKARAQVSGAKRRTVSAVARKRMAAAQRARWAKWKAQKKR